MNTLLKTKEDVEEQFRKKATMAVNLLGMVDVSEEAFGFLTGGMDEGWDITVGFFNQKARYIAFKKRTGTKCLIKPPSIRNFQLTELQNRKRPDPEKGEQFGDTFT
jgi:hypothetical protein